MKVLLDHNVPAQLKALLESHSCMTAREMRWDRLKNGDLLAIAEAAGFAVVITGDQNISYQINNAGRTISLIVITQTKRRLVSAYYEAIVGAIDRAHPGSYELVAIPKEPPGIRAVE